jgi:ferredoxin-NADP reductase
MQTTVKLIRKETIADNTMAFYFTKPKGFDFRAGQFADYTLITPRNGAKRPSRSSSRGS